MARISDEDERTNSMGLFNTAEAFRLSARALGMPQVKHGHADMPRRFLYYHALELYLKALLRQQHSVDTIKKNFGHDTKRLMKEVEALGLPLADEDRKVLAFIRDTDALNEARYIRTGAKTFLTFEALNRTCDSIREGVASILRKKRVMVRL